MRRLVGELADKLVGLNVYVLLARHGFWSFDISGEELFSGLGPPLLNLLGVIRFFIGLKQLVGVGASWDHHGCVGGSTEDSFVKHDILGLVVTCSIR